jgi:hypothetical protein
MTASRTLERRPAAPQEPNPRRPNVLHLSDLLLPVSILLWAFGLSRTHVPATQPYGLMTSLPLVYFAGIALLVVSAALELRHKSVSEWRLAAHAVSLVVMLFATAPLVYSAGRYAWLYKTIGVVQYINAHGRLNDQIDIYQNWPGFFALAGWFDKVAGVASPLVYAKWAQPVFELVALPLLYLIYDSLALPIRQRWVAIFLYTASNWVGQDYFSPQALGSVLSLGIMALALRWLYVPKPVRDRPRFAWPNRRRTPRRQRRMQSDGLHWWSFPREYDLRWSLLICGTIIVIYFALSMTHQLSPYMVAIQLGGLAVAGMLRPRWLPVALAAVAIGYLLPHFGFVNSHYGVLSSFGSFLNNAKPPSLSVTPVVAASETTIARCSELLSIGMWCLALVGAWLRRRSRQPSWALVFLAFSPFGLLAIQAYGNEGVLRVFLFSLPYTAALAAMALLPAPAVILAKTKHHRARMRLKNRGRGTVPVLIALGVVLALFFPAFFGNDGHNVMPANDVTTLTAFQQYAVPGTIYAAVANGPFDDTDNYNLINLQQIFSSGLLGSKWQVGPNVATIILDTALRQTDRNKPVYVVIAASMFGYNQAYGLAPADAFKVLARSLADTPPWQLIVHQGDVQIYELPPNTLPVIGGPAQSGENAGSAAGSTTR